jgi:Ser/Thr protein kinase RdoA (MazF antagonist)
VRAHPRAVQRFEQLGRAVAAAHQRPLPTGGRLLMPRTPAPGPLVWLHGDLALQNVMIDDDGAIVLLDWAPAAWLGEGEIAPAGVDLAMLMMSIFHRHLLHNFEPGVEAQAEAALRGYAALARPDWAPAALAPVVRTLLRRYAVFRWRAVGRDALRVAPGSARLLAWLPRLSALEFP